MLAFFAEEIASCQLAHACVFQIFNGLSFSEIFDQVNNDLYAFILKAIFVKIEL